VQKKKDKAQKKFLHHSSSTFQVQLNLGLRIGCRRRAFRQSQAVALTAFFDGFESLVFFGSFVFCAVVNVNDVVRSLLGFNTNSVPSHENMGVIP